MFLSQLFTKKYQEISFCQTCIESVQNTNKHAHHRTIHYEKCQEIENLQFELKIAQEIAFSPFYVLNHTNTFPNLRSLHIKYSGSIFNWIKYNPDPMGKKYLKIWDDINIEELSYDISEINVNDKVIQVLFRGFENLQTKLKQLNLNLFNTNLQTPIVVEILQMLQKFRKLKKFHLNLRRMMNLEIENNEFQTEFINLFKEMDDLEEVSLNLSQLININFSFILKELLLTISGLKVRKLSLSFRHSHFSVQNLQILLQYLKLMVNLENLTLDLCYNEFGNNFIQILINGFKEFKHIKMLDLKIDGCQKFLKIQDQFDIQLYGLQFLSSPSPNKQLNFSFPICYKKEFSSLVKQFDWLHQKALIVWGTISKSKLSKKLRKDILLEIMLDFIVDTQKTKKQLEY